MSISSKLSDITTAISSAYTAVSNKGGTVPSNQCLNNLPTAIGTIPSGGGGQTQTKSVTITQNGDTIVTPDTGYTLSQVNITTIVPTSPVEATEKLVNFYDYDGFRVASYTGAEIQALSSLPSTLDHSNDEVPLTFQQWNWTLAEIKGYNISYPHSKINVGASYIPTDRKTHLFFLIDYDAPQEASSSVSSGWNSVCLKLDTATLATSTFYIDWGDGSQLESVSVTSSAQTAVYHFYQYHGEYHCMISSNNSDELGHVNIGGQYFAGKVKKLFCSILTYPVAQYGFSLEALTIPYSDIRVLYNNAVFGMITSIKCIVIPRNVKFTISGSQEFYSCYAIHILSLPKSTGGVASLNESLAALCYSMRSFTIQSDIVKLETACLRNCRNIQAITIPSSVTSIKAQAFENCYSLHEIFCYPTSPPTLANTNAIYSYVSKIYVPSDSVNAYKSASNWSTFASVIEAMPS